MLKTFRKNRISGMAFTIGIFVVVITAVFTCVSYQISSTIIKKDAYRSNSILLEKLSDLVNSRLIDTKKSIIQFNNNNFGSKPLSARLQDEYEEYILYRSISEYLESNLYMESISIFYNNGESIFYVRDDFSTGALATSSYVDKNVYEAFISDTQAIHILSNRSVEYIVNNKTVSNVNMLTMLIRIPLGSLTSKNIIRVNLKEDYLNSFIQQHLVTNNNNIAILNESGKVIFASGLAKSAGIDWSKCIGTGESGEETTLNEIVRMENEKYYLTGHRDPRSGWTYLLLQSKRELLSSATKANTGLILIAGFILLMGFLFSTIMNKRYHMPVLSILDRLKGMMETAETADGLPQKQKKKSEFEQIETYINGIIAKNENQQGKLETYFSYYRERILYSLLTSDSETIRLINEDKINFENKQKWHTVIQVRLKKTKDTGDPDLCGSMFKYVEKCLCLAFKIDSMDGIKLEASTAAYLLSSSYNLDDVKIKKLLVESSKSLPEQYEDLTFAVSRSYFSIEKISLAFKEAEKIIQQQKLLDLSGVHILSDLKNIEVDHFMYPEDIEKDILKSIAEGNRGMLRVHIKTFLGYLEKYHPAVEKSKKYVVILLYNITGQIGSEAYEAFLAQLSKQNIFMQITALTSYEETENWLLETLDFEPQEARSSPSVDNRELVERVTRYIDDHYNEDIGLNTIADYVYLSHTYLGKLFKEVTGCSFTQYLLKVRMETAATLLLEKNVNITNIINKVGYTSIQSFSRVFRKYYNYSPSEYRKNHIHVE